jgi:hypothetical protein
MLELYDATLVHVYSSDHCIRVSDCPFGFIPSHFGPQLLFIYRSSTNKFNIGLFITWNLQDECMVRILE